MTIAPSQPRSPDYGPRRLTVELTNVCNLHCSYCLRDEDALYHSPANFLPVDLFARIARDARDVMGIEHVMFTGGEPTLHATVQEDPRGGGRAVLDLQLRHERMAFRPRVAAGDRASTRGDACVVQPGRHHRARRTIDGAGRDRSSASSGRCRAAGPAGSPST